MEQLAPTIQVRDAVVEHLRRMAPFFQSEIPERQIRAALDLSGEPKGRWGVAVSGSDLGGHSGFPPSVLRDISLRVTVYSHLNEDETGDVCDEYASQVYGALLAMEWPQPDGWKVSGVDSWAMSSRQMAESFRTVEITCTMYLQRRQ